MENKKENSFGKKIFLSVLLAVILGLGMTAFYLGIRLGQMAQTIGNAKATATPAPVVTPSSPDDLEPVNENNISAIAGAVMPAIVSVECKTVKNSSDFWGRPTTQESTSAGSGIIIAQAENKLYIATNQHVVDNASEIKVGFVNGAYASATLTGSDTNSDLAVIEMNIDALEESVIKSIRIATLGESEGLKAGDFAVAIGNALGNGQSITAGYISATKREVTIDNITRTLLQTDAAINPGNSGGALINANGEVIGINSAKYASENVEGIGYAIPISDAIPILFNLINREVVDEKDAGTLAIKGKTVTSTYSSRFGIPVGVYINEVKSNSGVEKAGIKPGDVITAINGVSISTTEDLEELLKYEKAGSTVTLTISELNAGKYQEREVEVVLDSKNKK